MVKSFDKVVYQERFTVTNAAGGDTILTVSEDSILRRIVGTISFCQSEDNAIIDHVAMITLNPGATGMITTSKDYTWDDRDTYWILYSVQTVTKTPASPGSYPTVTIPFDITINRTMEPNDSLSFRYVTNSANANYVTGSMTLIIENK